MENQDLQQKPIQSSPTPPSQNTSSVGGIIGTIIIIALIILGGLYFWGKRIEESRVQIKMTQDSTTKQ